MTAKQHYPMSVMFTSRDMQKSVAFYRDLLGFELEACWPDDKSPMWANLMLDGQAIMLGASMTAEAAKSMCGGDEGAAKYMATLAQEFQKNKPGVGVVTYVQVPKVDEFHAGLVKKGLKGLAAPKSQFYGIRDFGVEDPDGYRLLFYTTIQMESCQSCGAPMSNGAEGKDVQPGQMYCSYCVDEYGKLRPYEHVLEGTVSGYFVSKLKMKRPDAEKAAREHLAKMPAWSGRK